MNETEQRLDDTIRTEGTRILATLVRVVGDLQVAEDAVQEASARALTQWRTHGVPRDPRAWLITTARRAAIDVLRRETVRPAKERAALDLVADQVAAPVEELAADRVDLSGDLDGVDDRLRLLFTCAHPALSREAQVTLALRVLCGLSTDRIAAVLLTSESAVAKRLTRTRSKIARAAIPYEVPSAEELPGRLATVCAVVHAVYTAAHTVDTGSAPSDVDGCHEALRLARLVTRLMPDEAAPMAVLALLLLTEARRPARTDPDGRPVVLADQDRTRWDAAAVDEGTRLLAMSLRRTGGVADPYQLQAAIAAEHARAASYAETDWAEVLRLYDYLEQVRPSSAGRLARAVAVAEASGTPAGLAALDAAPDADRDHRWLAVRAELLARDGRYPEAIAAMTASLAGPLNEAEAGHRRRLVERWTELAR